ncbi:hypothetical protein DIURU_001622 [Diutina rugosa]|uniref:Meiotic sister chromatid recombination protein 1 n=1 Tax=Diutina rugosa TaxID=5481 RepID=A0A642UTH2_DIURU|nr:uncharacterized protein DIURU_001622 [Diutina rugosa]KAA8905194.1 hypothetical protein DIURU_001622 [Diutina rugosa]
MKLNWLLGILPIVAANFDDWSKADLTQFLEDRNVTVQKGDDLVQLAEEELNKLRQSHRVEVDVNDENQQHVLDLATDPHVDLNDLPYQNWQFLVYEKGDGSVADWLFDTWSNAELKRFLKENHVKTNASNKKDLIKAIQDNWSKIVAKHQSSGKYPGRWIYKGWSIGDLRRWLDNFEVEYSKDDNKDALIDKINSISYYAAKEVDDSKQSLFDSIGLADADIFDSSGNIKATFWDSWSVDQLRDWLWYHGYLGSSGYDDTTNLNKLKKQAAQYGDEMKSDIESWVNSTKDKVDPYLQKGKETVTDAINDTFLVGVDKWSKKRLRQFLSSRGVKTSPFASKAQLLDAVKKNRNLPLTEKAKNNFEWLVGSVDTPFLGNWVKQKTGASGNSRPDILQKLSDYLSGGNSQKESFKEQIKYYRPDYESFHHKIEYHVEHEKDVVESDVKRAYEAAVRYYDETVKDIESKIDEAEDDIDEVLQDIQDSAVHYSYKVYDSLASGAKEVGDTINDIHQAVKDFGTQLSDYLIELREDAKEKWYDAKYDGEHNIKLADSKARQHAKDVKNNAQDAWDETKVKAQHHAHQADSYLTQLYNWLLGRVYQFLGLAHHDLYRVERDRKYWSSIAKKSGSSFASVASKSGEWYADAYFSALSKSGHSAANEAMKTGNKYYKDAKKSGESFASLASKSGAWYADAFYSVASESGESAASQALQTGQKIYEQAKKSGEEVLSRLSDDAEYWKSVASKSGHSFASLASQEGEQFASLASKSGEWYARAFYSAASESGESFASEAMKTGHSIYEDAKSKADKALSHVSAKNEEAKSKLSKDADYWASVASKSGKSYASVASKSGEWYASAFFSVASRDGEAAASEALKAGNKIYEDAKAAAETAADDIGSIISDAGEKGYQYLQSSWESLTDSLENADLITYLQSFGYNYSFLKKLDRRHLKRLAKYQSDVFYGQTKDSWDLSIRKAISGAEDSLMKKLGIKHETWWDSVKLW